MRGLDHRSRSTRRRTGRRGCGRRTAGGDCRSCKELHGQIFAAPLGKEMKHIRHISLIGLIGLIGVIGLIGLIALAPLARAEISSELAEATNPLIEGVPEVA